MTPHAQPTKHHIAATSLAAVDGSADNHIRMPIAVHIPGTADGEAALLITPEFPLEYHPRGASQTPQVDYSMTPHAQPTKHHIAAASLATVDGSADNHIRMPIVIHIPGGTDGMAALPPPCFPLKNHSRSAIKIPKAITPWLPMPGPPNTI